MKTSIEKKKWLFLGKQEAFFYRGWAEVSGGRETGRFWGVGCGVPQSAGVSNVAEVGLMALLGYDNLTLTGSALIKVMTSSVSIGNDLALIRKAMSDPRYGNKAFSFSHKNSLEFGGKRAPGDMTDQLLGFWKPEYRDTWRVAGNELTWLLRHASVSGSVNVSADGSISISHSLYDVFDLQASPGRSQAYNMACTIFGTGWHGILGASSPTINGYWTTTFP